MTGMADFWAGKRVLLTGHTGFKGGWLALWLRRLGAHVTGIALPPDTEPNLFDLARIGDCVDSHYCDVRDATALSTVVRAARPEIVFHLAAQALVRVGYRSPLVTFDTNVMGTANLLDCLRNQPELRVAVIVTTDKVYRNAEWPYPYREEDTLGGHDPYSASKAACELVVASYRDSFFAEQGVAVATARAGNVIGGGDWALDRLIPDAVRAWQSGKAVEIRRPEAMRPWQHVLEPMAAYLALAHHLWSRPEGAGAYNFGPRTSEAATVREVIELARTAYGTGAANYATETTGPHEANWLALEIAKARTVLAVEPKWSLSEAVRRTMAWYRAQAEGTDARALCETDIAAFEAIP